MRDQTDCDVAVPFLMTVVCAERVIIAQNLAAHGNSVQSYKDKKDMSDSLIGKQLGDYQIRDLLGRGGMARVYTGYDARLDRLAAVKVINSDFSPADQAEYFERFQREARAIARLNHPNIVGVYQFGQYEESYYMAMVFVEGRDLRQILREYSDRRELIPVKDVLNVVRGIGSALDYAHSRGVIHRDIKPSNIMLTREGNRAILTDFGLALSTSEGTRGETFGSAHYIAPEQAISSAKAVPQSDLYSLGICLYEMLTGQVPFDDPSAMTVALKHLQDPPPAPRSLNSKLSSAIEYVLLKSIDKDPARRYPSGAELIRALEGALENQTLPDTSEIPVGQLRTAIQQVAQKGQEKPETTTLPFNTSSSPTPIVAASEKKTTSDDSSAIRVEIPPQPAEAITTETASISAIKPPVTDKLASTEAGSVSDDANLKKQHPVWLFGVLVALIILLVLGGGYVVGQNAGVFGTAAMVGITPSSVVATVIGTDLTPAALVVTIVPTDAVTGLLTQPATMPVTTISTDTPLTVLTNSATVAATASPSPIVTTAAIASLIPVEISTSSATLPTPSANPPVPIATDANATVAATTPVNANIKTGTSSATAEGNDVLILYNLAELNVINQANKSLSLAGVTFAQVGTNRTFAADDWVKISPLLKPGDCYQLFVPSSIFIQPSLNTHLTSPCGLYQIKAYYGPRYVDNYYFWAAIPQTQTPTSSTTAPPSNFNVLYNGLVIANCLYSDGRCSFSLPKSAN
jgi:serine/threonine protein kinase